MAKPLTPDAGRWAAYDSFFRGLIRQDNFTALTWWIAVARLDRSVAPTVATCPLWEGR